MGVLRCALYACVLGLLCSCRDSGQGRPEVVVYCSVDQAIAEPIIAQFERQAGIRVLARYDSEASKTVGLVQRLRAERDHPAADVFWSGEVFYMIRLAREGLLKPYSSDLTVTWPPEWADPNGYWYGFALRARVIVFNTRKVSADEAPHGLEDLMDPRWRGRIVMAGPEFGTTGGDVASWFAHYGRSRATEILKGLKSNGIRLVDGNSTVVRMVAQGQADLGMTDTDDVYAGQRNGWPVAMCHLDQAGDGALAIPNTVAVIKACPHPDQAKVLVEFLLGEQVEGLLAASDSHNYPIRSQVAEPFKAYAIPRVLKIDYQSVADQLPKAIRTAGEVLR